MIFQVSDMTSFAVAQFRNDRRTNMAENGCRKKQMPERIDAGKNRGRKE